VFSFHSKSSANARPSRVPRLQVNAAPSISEKPAVVRMQLVGANSSTQITAADQLPGKSNYYLGNDPQKWQTNVSQYARVAYKSVYRGIDLAYYGEQSKLEFDFIVAPASDPASIDLAFSGAQQVATDASGNLVISSAGGDVVLHKPVAYQQQNGSRQLVDASFIQTAHHRVSFHLGSYDRGRELVIDPTVTYSTYLGGSAEDEAYGVAVDGSGNAYVTGATQSINFPAPSGTTVSTAGGFDVFVSKLNPTGTALLYSTLIGGSSDDFGLGIAVNGTGTYVVGNTSSTNFPSTPTIGPGGGQDAFVAKLDNNTGARLQVTRIGGTGTESGNGIALDITGAAYIGGETDSTDFPIAGPPIQTTNAGADDGFIAKLDSSGTVLDYSTYIGGSAEDLVTGIALDGSNNAYVTGITISSDFPTTTGAFQTTEPSTTGDNGFVAAIKADGSAKIYSTYLGGSGTNDALAIAVDSAGEAYVTGDTNSSNFPVLNATQATLKGATDVFITKLQANGSGLLFSTYYGGTLDDAGTGIAIDAFNDVYVTGRTLSSDYPTNGTPFQSSLSGTSDAFVTELSNTGSPVYSSFLGGTGSENSVSASTVPALGAVAVDSSSNAYLAGSTDSTTGFPVSPSALQSSYGGGLEDGFVTKVGAAPADFSVAVSPATISVASGQTTATITVTVSSVNAAYNNAVTLSCAGKPSKAACNFSTLSVTPGSSPVTSNLTISTNGSTGNALLTPPMGRRSVFYAMLLPICGLAFLGAGFGYRNKKYLGIIALTLTLALLIVLPACGGGSSGGGGGAGGGNNTASGTYSLTVSGAAGGVTHSAPLTLTVN